MKLSDVPIRKQITVLLIQVNVAKSTNPNNSWLNTPGIVLKSEEDDCKRFEIEIFACDLLSSLEFLKSESE